MNQLQSRVGAGVALILAGVVVAVVGYIGVSQETVVAFQLPYFASAGVGALMLLGGGSALLITAQLERDTTRLEDLEDATRTLAAELGRLVDRLEPAGDRDDTQLEQLVQRATPPPARAPRQRRALVERPR
jgi:hypothetical protein